MRDGIRVALLIALGLAAMVPGHSLGDPAAIAAGERLFRSQCMGCHSLAPGDNRAGPTLHALFGRKAGSVEGFDFSPAMTESGIDWSSETLDMFLADPQGTVPGTRMVLWGLEDEPRGQLIVYLESISEQ